jgi:hypothetical protein
MDKTRSESEKEIGASTCATKIGACIEAVLRRSLRNDKPTNEKRSGCQHMEEMLPHWGEFTQSPNRPLFSYSCPFAFIGGQLASIQNTSGF